MRTITSTIRKVRYGTSNYLIEKTQPILKKNVDRVIDWHKFFQEAKTGEIYQENVQVSCDVVNIYSLVPTNKSTNFFIETLNKVKEQILHW